MELAVFLPRLLLLQARRLLAPALLLDCFKLPVSVGRREMILCLAVKWGRAPRWTQLMILPQQFIFPTSSPLAYLVA